MKFSEMQYERPELEAVKAELSVGGEVTVKDLELNEIASIWRTGEVVDGETVLYVSDKDVELDTSLTQQKLVTAYSTSGQETVWKIIEGEDVISLENTTGGVIVKALGTGKATIMATCGNVRKAVSVTVYEGKPETDVLIRRSTSLAGVALPFAYDPNR